MDRSIFFKFMSVLLVLAAIAAIAYLAFNAGVTQGVAARVAAPQGQAGGTAFPYYGWPLWFPGFPFYGFGFFGALFGLFLLFLVLRLITFAIWGPRWGYGRHTHGGWRHGWEDESGLPPMFKEWHDRAHKSVEPGSKP
jgi:hypothetical protein